MKRCTKCKEEKELTEFSKTKGGLFGVHSYCRNCMNERSKNYYDKNKEKIILYVKEYYNKNKEERLLYATEYHKKNRDKILQYNKTRRPIDPKKKRDKARERYWKNHEEELLKGRAKYKKFSQQRNVCSMQWQKENPEKFATILKRHYLKKSSDPKWRLANSIRSGIVASIRNGSKNRRHWEDLVGYTIDQLKSHLEKQFKDSMSWDNYGTLWEIDHKIPIAAHNFERPEDIDFHLCWSLKNLQPLECSKNRVKHNKIIKPFQPSLMMTAN